MALALAVLVSGASTGIETASAADASAAAFTRTKLTPPAPQEGNYFGQDVAIDGDTAVVSEYFGEGAVEDSGVAWVYAKQGGSWVRQAKLAATNGERDDRFGLSVAISGDTIVVGAEHGLADGAPPGKDGAAYVYVRSGDRWVEQAQLFTADGVGGSGFGSSVAISGDTIVVGAKYQGTNGPLKQGGAAYVYLRSGSSWTLQDRLESNDGSWDHLGSNVSIDGDTLAAAAPGDTTAPYVKDGAVYVFVRTGTTWALQQRAVVADAADNALLGVELDLDANTMVAQSNPARGAPAQTYVFVRSGSAWSLQGVLSPLDPDELLTGPLAVKGDVALVGETLGEIGSCSASCGVVYVFTRSGDTWTQKKIMAGPQGQSGDRFGSSIDFDGVDAIVGADGVQAPGGAEGAGAAFVYDR